jgi:hypothetical protein
LLSPIAVVTRMTVWSDWADSLRGGARKTLDPDARKILDRWINRNCRRKE